MRTLLLAVMLAGCGGKPPITEANPEMPPPGLPEAASMLCAAPKRAAADPSWGGTEDDKAAVIAKHYKDGIKSERVLAMIDGWSSKDAKTKVAEMDALLNDAHLTSKCELREVFAAAPASTVSAR